ncbi:MAG TPA: hypothetical protein VLL54_02270 [Pyrinomonadaceae bacterium]|nr:hypothetical protein [Pyrinomonadaceae bacterium]
MHKLLIIFLKLARPKLLLGLVFGSALVSLSNQSTSQIDVRNAHSMAYDSKRGRVILFGGADASRVRGDTWAWDGRRWRQLSDAGPGPRTFAAMVYDSTRDRIVLFGGNRVLFGKTVADNVFLADTWEWNGSKWIEINVNGPPARAEAAIAFDKNRRRVVLFGGYNRIGETINRLGDTWEWDGAKWMEVNTSGPSPRNGAAQVYDPLRQKVVLFGGRDLEGVAGDTWEWDGLHWKENNSAAVTGRFNCVLAYDEVQRRIVRFGGRYDGRAWGDTWVYDGKGWEQLSSIGPEARNHTAMVYDLTRGKVTLFGGHDGDIVFGDTWLLHKSVWIRKQLQAPRKRVENGH